MIRTSTTIGAAALVLSLVVHFFGVGLTFSIEPPKETEDTTVEQVPMSDAFEDLAETPAAPVEPDFAEVPEPPVENTPEPQPAEAPTTEVLVASNNPQRTFAPDSGFGETVKPDVSTAVTPEATGTQDPVTDTPSGGTETAVSDARIAAPVVSEPATTPPVGDPEVENAASSPPVEPIAPPVSTAPTVTDPVAPITAPVLPDVMAALPPEIAPAEETLQPEETVQEPTESAPTDDIVVSSLRPQLRSDTLAQQSRGTFNSTSDQSDVSDAPAAVIESPLTAYRRDGTNLFAGRRSGTRSGNAGSSGGLGPGNSDRTNYAGLVLMHLNRVPSVRVSARGWARVSFTIKADGTLASVGIVDGSGSGEIDRAARAQVNRGVPFPRPPGGETRFITFVYQNR